MSGLKTLFVLTHVPDPRINKRLFVARELGKAEVVCVRRSDQDVYEPAVEGVPHHILDMDLPTGEHPLKRLMASMRFAKTVWCVARCVKPHIIYTGSLDSLLISRVYKLLHRATRIVFEVADVRESFLREQRGPKRKLLSFLEKRLYPQVSLLVLTSEQFYKQYYKRHFSKDKTLVLQNIPDLTAFGAFRKKQGGVFTVGFIGGIRYLDQMKMLVDAAENAGVNVLFAGAGGTSADYNSIYTYCKGKDYVTFTGKYHYNSDIARLYGMVDCVYSVYDADNPNVRIALPNKLYEAAYCGLPIIVAKQTYLADIVKEYKLGFSVGHHDTAELISVIRKLKEMNIDDQTFELSGAQFLQQNGNQSMETLTRKLIGFL